MDEEKNKNYKNTDSKFVLIGAVTIIVVILTIIVGAYFLGLI